MKIETKFTPGPWKAHLNAPLAAIPGHIIKTDDSVQTPIALLWEGGGTHGKPTQIANARLIAAAPEMYAALTAANHALKSYQYGNSSPDLAENIGKAIDAALAAAEGRS